MDTTIEHQQQQQHHHNQHYHHLQQQPQPQMLQHQLSQQYGQPFQPNNVSQNLHVSNSSLKSINQEKQHPHRSPNDNLSELLTQLTILARDNLLIDPLVMHNREYYQDFVIGLQTRNRLYSCQGNVDCSPQYHSNMDPKRHINQIENDLRIKANELNKIRTQFLSKCWNIFDRLISIQNTVLVEFLPLWHHEQQLINNGNELETISLDLIQKLVEKIVEIIWKLKNQIKCFQMTVSEKPNVPYDQTDLENFATFVNMALKNLILHSFVVDKQPPQVMKTNTRFTATVRFLCGNKLNVQMINPTVKALILSEQNARTVISHHKKLIAQSRPSPKSQWSATPEVDDCPIYQTNQRLMSPQTSVIQLNNCAQSNDMVDTPMTEIKQQQPMHLSHDPTVEMASATSNGNTFQAGSTDRTMTFCDSLSPSQHFFQQQHHQPQQQQILHPSNIHHQYQGSTSTIMTSTTTQVQYGSITEIGYNPNIPVNSNFEYSGEILNNSNVLEFHEATGQMISHFRNMQLKKIKRSDKKGTESVTDEKFILLFFTEFRIGDEAFATKPGSDPAGKQLKRDLLFHLLAFSLPVVVIVHGNQEPHAWATVTWHNAFATFDEVLYTVPDRVPWRDLGKVLSEKFRSHAGRGLSQQNLKYLASKVYRNWTDNDDILVTWNQFSKENLSDKAFTFWEWFHSILKLTKDHLSPLWKADLIYGFIGKKGCVDLLLGSIYNEPVQFGTFLLRFSETELGGITIAWISSPEAYSMNPSLNDRVQISQRQSPTNTSANIIMHLEPFVSKDLATRPLADRIGDLKDLVYLYPNIPKNEALKEYYAPTPKPNPEYQRTKLVMTLETDKPPTTNPAINETSITPNSMSQSSPDGYYQENTSIDSSYPQYDHCSGDPNYSLQ